MWILFIFIFISWFNHFNALKTYNGASVGTAHPSCKHQTEDEDGNPCPTFEPTDCGTTEHCTITCNFGECNYMTIIVEVTKYNIEVISDGLYSGSVIAYTNGATATFTFNGGANMGTVTTYGDGNIRIKNLRDTTSVFLNGVHEIADIQITGWVQGLLSAINVKFLKITDGASTSTGSRIFLPIDGQSNTEIYGLVDENYDKQWTALQSLRGMENVKFFCDGNPYVCNDTASNHGSREWVLYYGKHFTSFCDISAGKCDDRDTSIGSQLEGYSTVYAYYDNTYDFRMQNSNIYLFYSYNGSSASRNTFLYGPTNADIIVIALGTIYMELTKYRTYDFTNSNNVILSTLNLKESEVHGPDETFTMVSSLLLDTGENNEFHLKKTDTIHLLTDVVGSDLYVGNNQDMVLLCPTRRCRDINIFTTLPADCAPLKDGWVFENLHADEITVTFIESGQSCMVETSQQRAPICGAYFKTKDEVAKDCSSSSSSSSGANTEGTDNGNGGGLLDSACADGSTGYKPCSQADPTGCPCNAFTRKQIELILDVHNARRDLVASGNEDCYGGKCPSATDMNYLFWDPGLEKIATYYAHTCPIRNHDSNAVKSMYLARCDADDCKAENYKREPVGENLALHSTISFQGIEKLVSHWFDESVFYEWQSDNVTGTDVWSQSVWARTRYVGCGYASCTKNLFTLTLVCYYYPGANFGNGDPYTNGPQCSNCEADRIGCTSSMNTARGSYTSYNALCGGPQCSTCAQQVSSSSFQPACDKTPTTCRGTTICRDGVAGPAMNPSSRDMLYCSPTPAPSEKQTDECKEGTDYCQCINTQGSYACYCNAGYSGDGKTCLDINECDETVDGTNRCGVNAFCTNTDGSFTCQCDAGYSGDGLTCTDIDECATDHNCVTDQICINNECVPNDGGDLCVFDDIFKFDWDELTKHGNDDPDDPEFEGIRRIPSFVLKFDDDKDDLSLHIEVKLEYVAYASVDNNGQFTLPVTYVLDFESYGAHDHFIYEPGTCQNRKENHFYDTSGALKPFGDRWKTSLHIDDIGTTNNMLFPPTIGSHWEIIDKNCKFVTYRGHFPWKELRNCKKYGGVGAPFTHVNDDGTNINLHGVFYVNLVSPFSYNKDLHFYRVYQILSKPFTISVSKSVQVLGSAGRNLITISVIAVYKQGTDNNNNVKTGEDTFKLILATDSAQNLELRDPQFKSFTRTTITGWNGKFSVAREPVNDNCLVKKHYVCSQLWEITAQNAECKGDGVDFSGDYILAFTPRCITGPQYTSIEECGAWMEEHPDIKKGVNLVAKLTWKDSICSPELFEIQSGAAMSFYITDESGNVDLDNPLNSRTNYVYQIGDTVYIRISPDYPSKTYHIFAITLLDVYICTCAPGSATDDVTDYSKTGCLSGSTDYYHIFSKQSNIANQGFEEIADTSDDSAELRFKFIVPDLLIQVQKLCIHSIFQIDLNELKQRRRLLKRTLLSDVMPEKSATHIGNKVVSIGITKHKNNKPLNDDKSNDVILNNNNEQPNDLPGARILILGDVNN